jgi:Undecaprenyl-phosphate glucose phosphotransferase
MLSKHHRFFISLLFLIDLLFISLSWLLAYLIRFQSNLFQVQKDIPSFSSYFYFLPIVLVVWGIVFKIFNLYRPRRISTFFSELFDITKACSFAALLITSFGFFLRQFDFSRLVFVLFLGLSIVLMTLSRWIFREILRFFRRRGYNLRYALIVGAGTLGQQFAAKLHNHPELGISIIGFLSRQFLKVGKEIHQIKVLGTYDDLPLVLSSQKVDYVFVAIPREEFLAQEKALGYLQTQTATNVHLIPDLYQYVTIRGHAEIFDGFPLLTLQATPLYGWNQFLKRFTDIVFSLLILIMASPLMITIPFMIKMTSKGPVFFRQKRIGFDGNIFEILKFRSMGVDAEKETGPVWANEFDLRPTLIGEFLRKTSLDELPQFFNVLTGDMSIVGPRPERPEFVEKFRTDIPKYMVRHKIKAGITGLAQIKGWRGNTSIEERVKCDLEYIEKWSLWLDLKIMLLTTWKGFINKNAY